MLHIKCLRLGKAVRLFFFNKLHNSVSVFWRIKRKQNIKGDFCKRTTFALSRMVCLLVTVTVINISLIVIFVKQIQENYIMGV